MIETDAAVIGGGFFGCHIALALKSHGFERVHLIERERGLMRRASFANQARVHNGYHYPRSLTTALSSHNNFERFVREHAFAIVRGVDMVYAIATTSRVSANQFVRFCDEIGAPCREHRSALSDMFDPDLIETCFAVQEVAVDTALLAEDLGDRLKVAGVVCRFGSAAQIQSWNDHSVLLWTSEAALSARYVFNCTYASLDTVGVEVRNRVKKELVEIALIDPPRELAGRAVTVMDGPFFSSMPFPALNCYSLTHVRYSPHTSWTEPGIDKLTFAGSRHKAMLRDASRYMPGMQHASYLRSLYELKAILVKSEDSDSRPIVFEQSPSSERTFSVMGSKLDHVYDILHVPRGTAVGQLVWESITAVAVIDDALPELPVFQNLSDMLAGVADDSEIVIIANGVTAPATKKLQAIVERVPDVTVHFLAVRADRDTAILLAIERALGDWIVVLTPSIEEVRHLPSILTKLGPCEIVFVGSAGSEQISGRDSGRARGYFRVFELISRISFDGPTPRMRIYARAAARYLANHLDGELMLRSLTLNGAFLGEWETVEGLPAENLPLPTLTTALRRASRSMLGASAIPLRATIGIALATGLLAMLNSLYAVIVYLVKPDVEPGWTTLSLQISMMTFLFSVMFALLAGYVLSVYRSIPPRRRISVIRELRSPLRRQGKRLNVVGGDGQFHLGA